jgi:2-methylcitrate dehydratase PrpD
MSMATISSRLADFAAGLRLDAVPVAVVQRAKHLMLDAIGCAFAAREEEFAARIARSVAKLA